jgi:lysozyme
MASGSSLDWTDKDWDTYLSHALGPSVQEDKRTAGSQPPEVKGTLLDMLNGAKGAAKGGYDMVNDSLINLVKQFESFRGKTYLPTPDDVPTIGYGTTKGVKWGDTITEEEASARLKQELEEFQNSVKPLIKVPLSENQLNAVTSLVYNIGVGAFKRSKALKALNAGDFNAFRKQAFSPDVGFVFQKGKRLKGLVNRRTKEMELFDLA